jgi:hypothetical protein
MLAAVLFMPLPAVVSLFGMAIRIQPGQKAPNAAARQRNARIRGAIVEIDSVSVRGHRIATREHDVLNISVAFVVSFGGKHPGITSNQAFFWLFKIK